MDYKDYYSILEIPRDADEQTIRSAFRRLARVHHPDVNANKSEATERFKEINEAYTVLSDPDKRARYDLFSGRYEQYQRGGSQSAYGTPGRARPGYGATGSARPGYGAAGGAGPQAGYGAGGASGHASAGPSRQRQSTGQQRRTRTLDEEDFERIFRGFAWAYSAAAGRRGRAGGTSDFSDFFEALFGNLWGNTEDVPSREPSEVRPGRDIEVTAEISLAEAYHGATRTLTFSDGRKVEVTIPPGVEGGAKLRIRGQGERILGRPRGDLYMTIQVQPHPFFTRDGHDLRVQVKIDHATATHSGEVTVPTMESSVKLRIPAGTRSGQSFRLRGLGMPRVLDPTVRGDLIATVAVDAPPRAQPDRSQRTSRTARVHPVRRTFAPGLAGRLRLGLGVALIVLALSALAAQALLAATSGWPLLAALAMLLLIHGASARSGWALAGSALAAGGMLWMLSQMEVVTAVWLLQQAWPVLILAVGVLLLQPNRRAAAHHS